MMRCKFKQYLNKRNSAIKKEPNRSQEAKHFHEHKHNPFFREWIYRSNIFFFLVYADSCLCLSFLTQICISVLVLAFWNLTPRTKIDLYHKVQLNSIMAYNTGKLCQKCQKLLIIFCWFRELCCLFSLFLLSLCPEMYF